MSLTEKIATISRGRVAVHPSLKKPATKSPMSPADKLARTLWKMGLLPFRVKVIYPHLTALAAFLNDLEAAGGSSGALSPIDLDRAGGGSGSGSLPPMASVQWERINAVMKRLQKHEVDLLVWIRNARGRVGVSLSTLGKERCNIEEPNRAQGAATGVLQSLAASVFEHYPQRTAWSYLHERGTKYVQEVDDGERYKRQKVPRAA